MQLYEKSLNKFNPAQMNRPDQELVRVANWLLFTKDVRTYLTSAFRKNNIRYS